MVSYFQGEALPYLGMLKFIIDIQINFLRKKTKKTTPLLEKWRFIYELAYKTNVEGRSFPIWGTCLGFQAIIYSVSDYKINTTRIDRHNVSEKISFIEQNLKGSIFEEEFSPQVVKSLKEGKDLSFF